MAKSSQKIKLKIVIRCQEILNLSHRDISYCDLQQELLLLWVIKFEWGKVKKPVWLRVMTALILHHSDVVVVVGVLFCHSQRVKNMQMSFFTFSRRWIPLCILQSRWINGFLVNFWGSYINIKIFWKFIKKSIKKTIWSLKVFCKK